jgi:hypothetical protein
VRGRRRLDCSADGDKPVTDLVTTSVQHDQERHSGLSVKQTMSFLIAHLALTSQQHLSHDHCIASTPAFCIRACFEGFTAFPSVGWKLVMFACWKGKESRCCGFERLFVRLLLLILLFLCLIMRLLHCGGRLE